MSNRHIGIYAGTFDPVHLGHIAFATQAMRECGLDGVVFLPEPKPRDKENVTRLSHRRALIKLATETEPRFDVLHLASRRFTVMGTLPKLQDEFGDAQLTFLMGSDVAMSLCYWKNIKTLLEVASLAIGVREGDDPREVAAFLEQLGEEHGMLVHYRFITTKYAGIASSKIRDGSAELSQIIPRTIDYIHAHGLYAPAHRPSAT